MDYEELKSEFIKVKREELTYLAHVIDKYSNKIISMDEQYSMYKKLITYRKRLENICLKLNQSCNLYLDKMECNDIILEFELDDYCLNIFNRFKTINYYLLIKDKKYILPFFYLARNYCYLEVLEYVLNTQFEYEKNILILCMYYDSAEGEFLLSVGKPRKDGLYRNLFYKFQEITIYEDEVEYFEKDKILIKKEKNVDVDEIRDILFNEIVNDERENNNEVNNSTK